MSDNDKQVSTETSAVIANLQASHQKELEQLHIQSHERIRQIEMARLKEEEKFETLEDTHAECLAQHRVDIQSLTAQLLEAQNESKTTLVDHAVLKTRLDHYQVQLQQAEAINQSLQEQLQQANHEVQTLTEQEKKSLTHLETMKLLKKEIEQLHELTEKKKAEIKKLKASISFQLGQALLTGLRSWTQFLRLPKKLYQIRRQTSNKRKTKTKTKAKKIDREQLQHEKFIKKLEKCFRRKGLTAAESLLKKSFSKASYKAHAITTLAKLALADSSDAAIRLARLADQCDPQPYRKKWLAFLLFNSGDITESNRILQSLDAEKLFKASELYRAHYIAGCHRLLQQEFVLPEPHNHSSYDAVENRVLYVCSSSMPYHTTGYTMRSHRIIKAISAHGWDVRCVTRPGYPFDRNDGAKITPEFHTIDGISYTPLDGPHRRKVALDDYIWQSANILANKAREERIAIIHAASNYEAALPALIAARKLGIPFSYEVRGLWEFTTASKIPGWENTERFALDKKLESIAVSHADCVFTLTQALADELQSRGASPDQTFLVPNAIDPETKPQPYDKSLALSLGINDTDFVIGYIGAIVAYEGLDDLIAAFNIIAKQHKHAKLLIVGNGTAYDDLLQQASQSKFGDRIIFTGKVQPDDVPSYFSLLNTIALPRKPLKLCHLVSPLKPFEAMAMGVPLVVSDVNALKEIVDKEELALIHEAGKPINLARKISRYLTNHELASKFSEKALNHVNKNHTWAKVSNVISESYSFLVKKG